ncbi:MAG: CHAP domain-containing protein, partial [Eggerthella lenta]
MPSDIKERVVARNVKTLDRAALLQKAARPAALRVGETAKAANPAHTRERRGDEAEGGWAAARGESERTAHEGFAATANGARVARAIRRRNVPKERARTTFPSAERGERRTPRGCAASCGSSREASSPSPRAPRPANARAREAMRTRAQAASRARAARA